MDDDAGERPLSLYGCLCLSFGTRRKTARTRSPPRAKRKREVVLLIRKWLGCNPFDLDRLDLQCSTCACAFTKPISSLSLAATPTNAFGISSIGWGGPYVRTSPSYPACSVRISCHSSRATSCIRRDFLATRHTAAYYQKREKKRF